MPNFSFPVQFYWITWFFSQYFLRGCISNFKSGTPFSQESSDESNKVMNSQKKNLGLRVCDLETTFGLLGPRRRIKPQVQNPSSNFHKENLT